MTTLNETNPEIIQEEGGESSVPAHSDNNIRIVHTISSSKSFESSSHAAANANKPLNSTKSEHVVRVTPTAIQNKRSFSDNNMTGKASRRTNSLESFASGEIFLSDSNVTPVVTDSEKQQISSSNLESPSSSYDDELNTEYDSSEEDGSLEDDSEVFLAKEMALAIAKNPNMTPSQLRELQQQVQRKVERKKNEMAVQKASKKDRKKSKKVSKKISSEMKAAYNGTKINAKEAYKQTMAGAVHIKKEAKAGANHIKKEARKGLRAASNLIKQSSVGSSTGSTSPTGNVSGKPLSEPFSSHITRAPSPIASLIVDDDQKVRLAGIVWKRRSGLGKYSMTAPWERRRVVLQGTRLIYYKTLLESQISSPGSDGEEDEEDESTSEREHDSPNMGFHASATSDDTSGWINTIMDKTGVSIPWETGSSTTSRGARGYVDLRKEKASAAVSYGHTGAPTPFALSIKVASTTKYKFCFETQQELMQWLSAITDVVVAGSVDAYNAEILEANDPSSHGDAVSAIANSTGMTWQEPSPRNAASMSTLKEEGRGHQLWSTERYLVSSEDRNSRGFSNSIQSKSNSPVVDNNEEENDNIVGASPDDYVVDGSAGGEDFLAIPAKYTEPAIYLINAVILASRADTTLSNELFWYVLVFFNVLGVLVINRVQVGGAIKLKPELAGSIDRRTEKNKGRKKKDDQRLPTINSSESSESLPNAQSLADANFVPSAGSTSMRIENPSDLPTKDGVIFPGWMEVDPSSMMVRGCGYKANKTKVACPNSLYRCVDVDVFESKARVPDMAGRVVLPTVNFDDGDKPKTWNAPDQFVITVALPTDPPKLYGGSSDNGGGYTITMYCVMRQETRDILRRVTADGYNPSDDKQARGDPNKSMVNAVKLFDEWCRRAPSDDNWMARFKVVPQGNNLAEIGLPSWISNYNGKPFLIKRPGTTGFLYRHPDKSCMEFDVSLHPFPYLAKQGICYLKEDFFKKILATLAFCIEGRTDDELPECLIGLYQICYPNPIHATQGEEFFAGKSARSK